MIEVKINGGSWTELEQQIAGMIREGQQSGESDYKTLYREHQSACEEIQYLREQQAKADKEVGLARKKCAKQEDELTALKAELDDAEKRIAELEKALDSIDAENPTPSAATTASEQTATVTDTESDPATGLSTTSKAEQPTYKKEEVRAFLASAREAGVDITRVLKPFGGRLPAVKEEDYPALMEAAKAALAELKEKK